MIESLWSPRVLVIILAAYLLGAVPFGLLIGFLRGKDIRQMGSGNIGATNVARCVGKTWGVITLVLDVAKAALPVYLASRLAPEALREVLPALAGLAAFLGHLYPVYLGFRGGKGVATAVGVYLFLCPVALAINVIIFVAVVAKSGYVSLGSLLTSLLMPALVWFTCHSLSVTLLASVMALLIWWRHRENIARLLRGEEKSWRGARE
ncbi:glycerol-3-phosphate 1-O-acyltransferase PlsY [Thermosulfuriphilus ammonigenes]|uniref:Glycerol-3-phosphate acyltransferase n=1 Tax=Thermosulfuriphilus ammonigenes TaxID=1936021 RepID=A0A6G7PWP8_9BACT|nr:glycerol-3-phosphate 1-O-acyltransferase PlsY [Thermosulfuriphilus ammonigenes]MBA2847859.1 glycerol-3-phosphate acyltransferase PlsY [Thermosulfuriphilus ammonigenes]QIJ71941.1 glycerol-3-phosphate 1-O-acyltransferase PlsY [Thermosulfuriphilus ammonigenes]